VTAAHTLGKNEFAERLKHQYRLTFLIKPGKTRDSFG